MKHFNLCLLAGISSLITSHRVYSQDVLWEKSHGGRHAEYLFDIQPTADYGFILAGSSLSNKTGDKNDAGSGDLDYWLCKMDEHGGSEWQKSIGGAGSDMLKSIRTTRDGGFILAGTSNSPKGFQKTAECHGGNDYWVIKLDAKGGQMWQKTFGGIGQDELQKVVATGDGGYLLAGTSSSSIPSAVAGISKEIKTLPGSKKESSRGNTDYWLVKIDADGNEEWQKTYGGQYADQLRDVEQTTDGGYIVGGYSNSPSSGDKSLDNQGQGGDFWILKLDGKGKIQWQQTIGGNLDDQLYTIHQNVDLGYIVGGSSNSSTKTSKNGTDLWVLKLDGLGEIIWEEAYDFGSADILISLVENPDGTFLLGGNSPMISDDDMDREGINDYNVIKISEKGEELWRRSIGSEGEDILKKLVVTRDGGYIMAGTSDPEFKGHAHRRKRRKKDSGLVPLDGGKQLEIARRAQAEMDNAIGTAAASANGAVNEQLASAAGSINDAIDANNDSALKVGVSSPVGSLLNPTSGGGSRNDKGGGDPFENQGPKPGAKISRDKKVNFGGKDFWVVKLKDRKKPEQAKIRMEVIPNPVVSYTNIIVGFDFDSGTARVFDISGRELQKFPIDSRTVPLNFSGYPMGVYIVSITTNKGEGSVKVIKNE